MQKRRSHTKSRNGCDACKKQHVKCDEKGPPCGNCRLRDFTCIYKAARPSIQSKTNAISTTSKVVIRRNGNAMPPRNAVIDDAVSLRLFELELMHRWTTSTYIGFSCIPEDRHYLSTDVSREALNVGLALDALFAVSALDLAVSSPQLPDAQRKRYTNAAVQYYGKAIAPFRTELESSLTAKNLHIMVIVSEMIACINHVLPQCLANRNGEQTDIVRRILTYFSIIHNTTQMARVTGHEGLYNSSYPMELMVRRSTEPPERPLDDDTKFALDRLNSLNEEYHDAFQANPHEDAAIGIFPPHKQFYKEAILHLKACFILDSQDTIQGWCTAFPSLVGPKFGAAVLKQEPMALIIMMHWAVVLHRNRDLLWWVGSCGRELVDELSRTIEDMSVSSWSAMSSCIIWTQHQVSCTS